MWMMVCRISGSLSARSCMSFGSGGRLTAQELGRFLARPLTDSTILTVLRRLEAKDHESHTVEDHAFVYRATEPRAKVAATAVDASLIGSATALRRSGCLAWSIMRYSTNTKSSPWRGQLRRPRPREPITERKERTKRPGRDGAGEEDHDVVVAC
jgi:hypothetical protein